jgi:DNA-binding response OmpR family regulator
MGFYTETMKLLIIEDDTDTLEFLKKKLQEKCCTVDTARDGDSGSRRINAHTYDIILIDYSLPGKDGFSLIKEVRGLADPIRQSTPIIMISVTQELLIKISALDYGADDYVPKPFFFGELFARMQAVIRRPRIQTPQILRLNDVVLDSVRQHVTKNGAPVRLTRKEFALLEYLLKHQGKILSRSEIIEHVWDMNSNPFTNAIDMHVTNIRKKIESAHDGRLIHNVPGRGYIINHNE